MKITSAHVYAVDLPVTAEVPSIRVGPADGESKSFLDFVVKLETDAGITGYGEVCWDGYHWVWRGMLGWVSLCTGYSEVCWDGYHWALGMARYVWLSVAKHVRMGITGCGEVRYHWRCQWVWQGVLRPTRILDFCSSFVQRWNETIC